MRSTIDPLRVNADPTGPVRQRGARHVLYWMTAARRPTFNFGLQRAVEWSIELGLPLVVLEALRCGYPWASDRLHRFVLQGMEDNARHFARLPVTYHPYVERAGGDGRGLLAALARRAAVVVTDEYPTFFLPAMRRAAARQVGARMEVVDSLGLAPLRDSERAYPTAHVMRRRLQWRLPEHLGRFPADDPLDGVALPAPAPLEPHIAQRWPSAAGELLGRGVDLAALPMDHGVAPVALRGGFRAADERWRRFHRQRLAGYASDRNQPDQGRESGLSPYLHFGHISPHQVVGELLAAEGWTRARITGRPTGSRAGWWDLPADHEAFLDQVITWRELGHVFCFHRPDDHDTFDALPDWARATLLEHAGDPREHLYTLEQFEAARTHDELWNAAQTELVREGKIHNYLRMLWGKKILHWTPGPQEALSIMVELNNRYALDGRDPNSYSGIFWVLGRHDRPWGPERPVFGKVRYMSCHAARRKLRLRGYLARHGAVE